MSDSNREHLSTLMDGEMDRRGARFMIRRLTGDGRMVATWRRYHLVRNCMRKVPTVREDLTTRVARALESETISSESPGNRWFKPVAGGAIAATVALMAIVAVNSNVMQTQAPGETRTAESAVDSQESTEGFVSESSGLDRPFIRQPSPVGYSQAQRQSGQALDRDRINSYVLRHNQAAGTSGRTGFVSYVPIVTADPAASADSADTETDRAPETD